MDKNYKKAINTDIRIFYSSESSLKMSFFNANISFSFCRDFRKNNPGYSQYDSMKYLATTVNYAGAFFLYKTAMSIVNGTNYKNEVVAVLKRGNVALILEYKPNEHSHMVASLTIDNTKQAISYNFSPHSYQVKEDGRIITKILQSELGAFALTIRGYLTGVGADRHLEKLPADYENTQDENQEIYYTTENNGHQQGNYGNY